MAEDGQERPNSSLERSLQQHADARFDLRLYVLGATLRSANAVERVKSICERHLLGRYDLQVIDLYQQPEMARTDQIIAAPTLVKNGPPPLRRMIGDLSNEKVVLRTLGVAA